MNGRTPFSEDQIEGLVRGYLDAEASEVDLARNLAEIGRRQRELNAGSVIPLATTSSKHWGRTGRRLAWRIGLAACVVVAIGVTSYMALSPEPASAYALVREAESALAAPVDRCYRVESEVPKVWRRGNPLLQDGDETRVWTRGDQFRVQTSDQGQQYNWGQDAQRRLWVVCDPQLGVRFDRQEVPPMLARTRTFLGLDVRQLAKKVLNDFDLHIAKVRSVTQQGGPHRLALVLATAKQGRPGNPFNTAQLEIDLTTKVIGSMELARVIDGEIKARFRFTLIDQAAQPAGSYELESQLQPGGRILGHDQSSERTEALRHVFESRREKR